MKDKNINLLIIGILLFTFLAGTISLRLSYINSDTDTVANVAGIATGFRNEYSIELEENSDVYLELDSNQKSDIIKIIPRNLSSGKNHISIGKLINNTSFRKDFVISFMVKGYVQDIVSMQFLSGGGRVPVTEESFAFNVLVPENSTFDIMIELDAKENINFPFEINLEISQ